MRFAVISDVQGNLAALQAVLEEIDRRYPDLDRIVSAGDNVGRGPRPNEVLDLLRERDVPSVRGNYDDAVARDREGSGMDFPSREEELNDSRAIAWTRRQLTEENHAELTNLPRDMRLTPAPRGVRIERNVEDDSTSEYRRNFILRALFGGLARTPARTMRRILLVHGSPRALNEFVRADTAGSILASIAQAAQADVIISGHAGVEFQRRSGDATFIGVGPVSGPYARPGIARFAVIDAGPDVEAEFAEVSYDAAEYVEAILESGLPGEVAGEHLR